MHMQSLFWKMYIPGYHENIVYKNLEEYLKSHANKKTAKEPVLGELWNLFNENEIQSYEGELMNFEIDLSLKNIFEAA